VFFGIWNGDARPDPDEAEDWKYMSVAEIEADMQLHPDHYTVWLRTCWDKVREQLRPEPISPA
jgi:isopentenyl-diphosphate delta-isomerase